MINHNYTLKYVVGNWLIEISPSTNYGCFENQKSGLGGGLWFADDKTLIDYDGVFELPGAVKTAILSLDYKLEG